MNYPGQMQLYNDPPTPLKTYIFFNMQEVFALVNINKNIWHTIPPFSIICIGRQGGKGLWAVYYTSPQSFIKTFPYSLS